VCQALTGMASKALPGLSVRGMRHDLPCVPRLCWSRRERRTGSAMRRMTSPPALIPVWHQKVQYHPVPGLASLLARSWPDNCSNAATRPCAARNAPFSKATPLQANRPRQRPNMAALGWYNVLTSQARIGVPSRRALRSSGASGTTPPPTAPSAPPPTVRHATVGQLKRLLTRSGAPPATVAIDLLISDQARSGEASRSERTRIPCSPVHYFDVGRLDLECGGQRHRREFVSYR
jgi:hypothetical protein